MKVLLTGATGFIGSRVARTLVEANDTVTALVRSNASAPAPPPSGVAELRVALDDQAAVRAAFQSLAPDVVMHLAWYANPRDYLRSPENIAALYATLRFAEAVLAAGCRRFVGVGTCLEYADLPRPRREDDATDPQSLYASAKLGAYFGCRALAAAHGAAFAWGRIFHVHGPGERPGRLLAAVLAALRAGETMDLSPGDQLRDHLHVDDVARALVAVAKSDATGPVNICSGVPVTLRRVLETVAELAGAPPGRLRFGARPYAPGEVMTLAGDARKLRALGFEPAFPTLRAGLADVVNFQ